MAIRFSCKRCGFILKTTENAAGKKIKCPNCGKIETVPDNSNKIKFHCKTCDLPISISKIHAGKKGKCPKCRHSFIVPNFKTIVKDSKVSETSIQNQYESVFDEPDDSPIRSLILPLTISCIAFIIVGYIIWAIAIRPMANKSNSSNIISFVKNSIINQNTNKSNSSQNLSISGKKATALKITDKTGQVTLINNPHIDYTSYSIMYSKDIEYKGIRIYEGEGKIVADWKGIDQITISNKLTDKTPYRLTGEMIKNDGIKNNINMLIDSRDGLIGNTDIGEFSIRLEDIKNIEVLKKYEDKNIMNTLQKTKVTGLKITDTSGTNINIKNAKVDYTSYSMIYTTDYENGLRVSQGDGVILINWEYIKKLTIDKIKTDTYSNTLKCNLLLNNGQSKTFDVIPNSKNGLFGQTSIGEYRIRVDQIKSIEVLEEDLTFASNKTNPSGTVRDVTVKDISGNNIEISNPTVDYTLYNYGGFFYIPESDYGIRVYHGEGIILLNWKLIDKITIQGKKTNKTPYHIKAQVTLQGGEVKNYDLVMDSKEGLAGKTNKGDFSIRLEDINSIIINSDLQI